MGRRRGKGRTPGKRPEPTGGASRHPAVDIGLVVGFTMLAAAFHVLSQSQRPLWLDEASTYWTVQANVVDLLRGARTDGTPPLYFLIVSAVAHLFGSSEIALRLPSLVAATALVPAIYIVSGRFASRGASLMAAGLTAISPLVHYYAVEARNYSILELETLAILLFAYQAILAPQQFRWWALLSLAQAIQLWTHNYALFLLPVPAMVCLFVGGRTRVALAVRAGVAASVALAVDLPWFMLALQHAGTGVGDWIRPVWEATPPSAAILRSLEVFGFGGLYPQYLTFLGPAPSVRVPGVLISVGLLAIAVLPWAERSPRDAGRSATYVLLGFLFMPLLGAWLYSYLREPLYVIGRYDTIVLPIFLILFAVGLDKIVRAQPWVGGTLLLVVIGLAVVSSSTAFGAAFVNDPGDMTAAAYLAREAAPADPIVFTGYRRAVIAYYLDRAGRHAELESFPFEIGEHPGWYSAARMLRDKARLATEAEQLVDTLTAVAKEGHTVWLLVEEPNEIDNYLYRPLLSRFVVDETRTQRESGLIGLRLRGD